MTHPVHTHYLHTIYTLFVQYLHTICTLSTLSTHLCLPLRAVVGAGVERPGAGAAVVAAAADGDDGRSLHAVLTLVPAV